LVQQQQTFDLWQEFPESRCQFAAGLGISQPPRSAQSFVAESAKASISWMPSGSLAERAIS